MKTNELLKFNVEFSNSYQMFNKGILKNKVRKYRRNIEIYLKNMQKKIQVNVIDMTGRFFNPKNNGEKSQGPEKITHKFKNQFVRRNKTKRINWKKTFAANDKEYS